MNKNIVNTGYPSMDRPWEKYYTSEALNGQIPGHTIYESIRSNCIPSLTSTAINYYNNKIAYITLLSKIDDTMRAFAKMGIKKGDIVALCMPTLPESIYCLYALNGLGAIANLVDPRDSSMRIKNYLNEANTSTMVIIDICRPKIDAIIDETKIKNVISVSVADSLPFGLNYTYRVKKYVESLIDSSKSYKKDKRYIKWNNFIKIGYGFDEYHLNKYTPNETAVIVHTSGTTGIPKGVKISNDSLNAVAYQYKYSGISNDIGDRFLDVMPLFLLYGLACGIHMPLSLGMEDIIIPQVDRNTFDELMLKYKPNHFMGIPTLFEKLVDSKKMVNQDLSYLISPGVGGDALLRETELKTNKFLEEHNCPTKVAKGYGMTEGGSALIVCVKNDCNELGSVGIPLCKNTISIFKYILNEDGSITHTDEELKYNEHGEICANGPSLMLGYYNNEEETNRVLRKHSDGKIWLHTSDVGYINEEGHIFIDGRIKRMIIRPDGHNVFPSSIENIVSMHPEVSDCAVVGIDAIGFDQGKLPKAVIVLKDKTKKDQTIHELFDLCKQYLPERDVAYYYEIVDEIPMTNSGKVDYRSLESATHGEFIDAQVEVSCLVDKRLIKK